MSTENDISRALSMLVTCAVNRPGTNFSDVTNQRDLKDLYESMRDQGRTPQFGTLELMARILMLDYNPDDLVKATGHCQNVKEARSWLSKATNKLLYKEEFMHD